MKLNKTKLKILANKIFSQFPYRYNVIKVADLVFLPDENSNDSPCITYEPLDSSSNFCVENMSIDYLRLRPVIAARAPVGYDELVGYLMNSEEDDIMSSMKDFPKTTKPFVEYTVYMDTEGELGFIKGKIGI